jgi:cytochrome P450 family 142 subfamily A polypeptide 1
MSAADQAGIPNPSVLDRDLLAAPRERTLPVYRWLRDEAPCYWDEGGGVWCLSRHEDVIWGSKHTDVMGSAAGTRPNTPTNPSMINQDEPRHGVLRKFVSRGFTPRQLKAREHQIRTIARRLIDDVAPLGKCDFVPEIAARLPLAMIGQLLGIPEEDHSLLGHWSDTMTLASDSVDEQDIAAVAQSFSDYATYILALCERKRRDPGDDLISILVRAEVDGRKLDDPELVHETLLLLVGGSETSRNVIAGGVDLLSRHPDQKQLLIDDPTAIPGAVEEFIRWVTPILNMKRTIKQPIERHGQTLQVGDQVVLLYPSANFDERVFRDPDRLDVTRSPNPHLAFGIGNHFCLGANLARIQIRVMYEELLARLPDIRVQSGFEPEYAPSAFVHGFLRLPVEFTPSIMAGP